MTQTIPELPLLYCWGDQILYMGRQADRGFRQHENVPAAVLLLAIEGEVELIETDNQTSIYQPCLYLSPHANWQDAFSNNLSCAFMIDPFSKKRHILDQVTTAMKGKVRSFLDEHDVKRYQEMMTQAYQGRVNKNEMETLLDSFFHGFSPSLDKKPYCFDPRIEKVGQLLRENFRKKKPTAELAAYVGLSDVHLVQLFKKQTGITIGRYVTWCRFMTTLQSALSGSNVTEAAFEAGFSDAAHFSRVFKAATGVSPDKYWPMLQALAQSLSVKK